MIRVKRVPITITDTGEKTIATVEVHEVFERCAVMKIIFNMPLDYRYTGADKYHIQIGTYSNVYTCYSTNDFGRRIFIQADIETLGAETLESILKRYAIPSNTKDDTAEKMLLKELNDYFKSDECTISYRDANKIEEIIINVLKGE